MTSPRTRRLQIDSELMRQRFAAWPMIEIIGTAGIPSEIYRLTYHIKGLYVDSAGSILERDSHVLEVNLSLGYPRRAPQCRMLTPVFHPNFDDASVCIGDFWAASEGLDDLIIRIGRMIAFQEYNTRSPLNGLAARWADQNAHLLPIDHRVIAPPGDSAREDEPPTVQQVHENLFVATPPSSTSGQPSPVVAAEGADDPWNGKIVIDSFR